MPCVLSVQAARVSADAVAAAVTLTNDCIKDGNAVEATSKAAASAWRSSQVSSLLLLLWSASSLVSKDCIVIQAAGKDLLHNVFQNVCALGCWSGVYECTPNAIYTLGAI